MMTSVLGYDSGRSCS